MKHIRRMQKKQSGFTLVELLVAMLCATLAVSMVISTFLFITFTTDELIETGSERYSIQSIKNHILSQEYTALPPTGTYTVNTEAKTLSHNGTVLVKETQLLEIAFSKSENLIIYCELIFPDDSYRFAVGIAES